MFNKTAFSCSLLRLLKSRQVHNSKLFLCLIYSGAFAVTCHTMTLWDQLRTFCATCLATTNVESSYRKSSPVAPFGNVARFLAACDIFSHAFVIVVVNLVVWVTQRRFLFLFFPTMYSIDFQTVLERKGEDCDFVKIINKLSSYHLKGAQVSYVCALCLVFTCRKLDVRS